MREEKARMNFSILKSLYSNQHIKKFIETDPEDSGQ